MSNFSENLYFSENLLLKNGEIIDNNIVITDILMIKDEFEYYKCTIDEEEYEIKMIRNKNKEKQKIMENEINILLNLTNFEKMPKYFAGKDLNKNIYFYIAKQKFQNLSETTLDKDEFIEVILSIYNGMIELHEQKILYVDFSPERFSWDGEKIYFNDFSLSQFYTLKNGKYLGDFRNNENKNYGDKNFISLIYQKGGQASMLCDLESFGYLTEYLFNDLLDLPRTLPWFKEGDIDFYKNKEIIREKEKKNIKFASYILNLRDEEKINYEEISLFLLDIYDPMIFEELKITKTNVETESQYEFRKLLYKYIGDKYNNINQLTIFFVNRYWYDVTYDKDVEKILDEIENFIK